MTNEVTDVKPMECLFLSDLGFPSFQLDRQVAFINLLSN